MASRWGPHRSRGATDKYRSGGPSSAEDGLRHRGGAEYLGNGAGPIRDPIRAEHDGRIEQHKERGEVAAARCGEERRDDFALADEIGVGVGSSCLYPPAPAGELSGGSRRAFDDSGDQEQPVDGNHEHVVSW